MQIIENILLALSGLKSNKMRSLLTMLGIIIGIGSVIAIVTVGNSFTASMVKEMESLGVKSIMVYVNTDNGNNHGMSMDDAVAMEDKDFFNDEDIDKFKKRFADSIEAISISVSGGSAKAKEGRLYANVSVTGTDEGSKSANNTVMLQGRYLKDSDIKASRKVVVVSDKLVKNMFPNGEDPIGKEIKFYSDTSINTYTIVGVYEYKTFSFMGATATAEKDVVTAAYIPVSVALQDSKNKNYQNFMAVSKTGNDAKQLTEEIKKYFEKAYNKNPKLKVSAESMEAGISMVTNMLNTVSIAISVIAAISLLVGGIGVMNIMLVSVTERTREIGTRKALGAKSKDIMTQFIIEAVIVCMIGGVIGIGLGLGMGIFGASLMGKPAIISSQIIFLSVGITVMIGIFFGFYPAQKAAKLDPIEALRYE